MNNSNNENQINVTYLEAPVDYLALVNEVNKTLTALEIITILNNDLKENKISLFRYELFIGHLDIAIRFNEIMRLRNSNEI